MAKINLGRVGFVIEGDYDASKTYKVLSIVLYEGSSYCCIKDTLIAGVLPTNEEYFVLHSLRGIQGEPGIGAKGDKGDALKFEDLTPEQLESLTKDLETLKYSVRTVETKVGQIGILGSDYDLFRIGIEISGIPKVLNEEVTVTIADIPVGMNMYLKVDSLVVAQKSSVVSEYFNTSYEISKLFVDEDLKTKVTIKCIRAVAVDVVAYIQAEYIKGFGDMLELSITVPVAINPQDVSLTFPKLKYNKNKVISLTVDDCYSTWNNVFSPINKRWVDNELLSFFIPGDGRSFFYHKDFAYTAGGVTYNKSEGAYPTKALEYTDGAGIRKRLAFTNAYWPWKMGARDYIGTWAWPWITPPEARMAFDFGSTMAYHDLEAVEAYKTANGNTNVSQEFFAQAVKDTATLSKSLIDYAPKVIVNPNGDPNYVKLSWTVPEIQYQVAAAILPDGQGTVFDNRYFKYNSDIVLNDKEVQKFITRRLFYNSGEAEFKNFIATNQAKPDADKEWCIYGIHRPTANTRQLLIDLEELYGATGDDSMWMPSLDEFFEYWFMTKYGAIHKTIDGQVIKFRIYLPCNDNFWFKSASVLASGISDLTGVSVAFSDNCYGGSFGISDSKLLVNFDFNQAVVERANRYLTILETNPNQEYAYDDAAYFVQQIRNDLRASYQARLDVFGTSPTLNSIVINNGDSETSSRDITIQLNKVGIHTHIMISEVSDFSGASWIENGSNSINYTCSEGLASKTIYVKIKNSLGESASKFSSITLVSPTTLVLNSVTINSGNDTTSNRNISVSLNLTGTPTHYMISENSAFTGASWLTYSSPSLSFTLTETLGAKTVYVKIKDATNESASKYDSITLEAISAIVLNSVSVNAGAASTTSRTVSVAIATSKAPTHYRMGEVADLSGVAWTAFVSSPISFTLTESTGVKTVYVQVKDATSESSILNDSITLEAAQQTKAVLSFSYNFANGNVVYDTSTGKTINTCNAKGYNASYTPKQLKSLSNAALPWYINFDADIMTTDDEFTDAGAQITDGASYNPTLSGNTGPYEDIFISKVMIPTWVSSTRKKARLFLTLPAGSFVMKFIMSTAVTASVDEASRIESFYRVDVGGVKGTPVVCGPSGFTGVNNVGFNAEISLNVATTANDNVVVAFYSNVALGRPGISLIEITQLP